MQMMCGRSSILQSLGVHAILILIFVQRGFVADGVALNSQTSSAKDLAVVQSLLQRANIPLDQVKDIHRVTAKSAFCNALYRVERLHNDGRKTSYMAKVFSSLATSRMRSGHLQKDVDLMNHNQQAVPSLFRIDKLAAKHEIGPQIYATIDTTDSPALLMQDCPGKALTEQDLHHDHQTAQLAATALAHLHRLDSSRETASPNMLWQSCDVLMEQYADPKWKAAQDDRTWTHDRLFSCIKRHQSALEARNEDFLVTNSGHGDCKPSNLLIGYSDSQTSPCIRFLDLELAGTHYVAFDLAKLWRSSEPLTEKAAERQEAFLETYAACCINDNMSALKIQEQINQLLPLTWLEAAAFFVAMSSFSSKNRADRDHWDELALDRLRSYEECMMSHSERKFL